MGTVKRHLQGEIIIWITSKLDDYVVNLNNLKKFQNEISPIQDFFYVEWIYTEIRENFLTRVKVEKFWTKFYQFDLFMGHKIRPNGIFKLIWTVSDQYSSKRTWFFPEFWMIFERYFFNSIIHGSTYTQVYTIF